jgi:folate-binding protein YgfZ
MNPAWKSFIEQSPTPLADTGQTPECSLFDLSSQQGLLRLEGEDALTFMQGQFTNDSAKLAADHSQTSAICSPKGRMLALFRIIGNDKAWLLQMPHALLEGIRKRLQMFVLRSSLTITDASTDRVQIGLAGECAEQLITELLGNAPENTDEQLLSGQTSCVRLGGPLPRFLLVLPVDDAMAIWQKLAEKARPADHALWKLLAIRAGEPVVHADTAEAFVPQMLNLQQVNGLSFSKGCYTGQEVVARMQYLGKLKRRMYRARLKTTTPPRPGDELFSPQSASGQGAGRVVEAAPCDQDSWEILAVIEIAQIDSDIHLGQADGPLLELLALPYSMAEDAR